MKSVPHNRQGAHHLSRMVCWTLYLCAEQEMSQGGAETDDIAEEQGGGNNHQCHQQREGKLHEGHGVVMEERNDFSQVSWQEEVVKEINVQCPSPDVLDGTPQHICLLKTMLVGAEETENKHHAGEGLDQAHSMESRSCLPQIVIKDVQDEIEHDTHWHQEFSVQCLLHRRKMLLDKRSEKEEGEEVPLLNTQNPFRLV